MLTQISLMPTSRCCFGNPSSIVPSKAVCTKHRVLCTQQTGPSRGTLIPSAEQRSRARQRDSPLRIYAMVSSAQLRFVPCFGVGNQERERSLFPARIRALIHGEMPRISPRRGPLAGSRRVARQTHVRAVLFASALFARLARPHER